MIKETLKFFSILQKTSQSPSPVACNYHLHNLAKASCGALSLKILSYFLHKAYGAVVAGLCINGKLHKAIEFLEDMVQSGLVPDGMVLTTIMDAYFKSGNLKGALDVYKMLLHKGFEPDVVTLSSLMDGLCKHGHLCEAKGYFCKEKSNKISYTVLIDGMCKAGELSEVEKVVREMSEAGFTPDKYVYTSWIAGLCKQGNLADAFKLKNKMVQEGLEPDLLTYSSLIFGLVSKGLMIEAKHVFDVILKKGLTPDSAVFDILIRGYLKESNTLAVSDLLKEMRKRRLITAVSGLLGNEGNN
ncbi:pentatricopeptide repeat-containing protein At2g01740 isoform X2 [Carica papaya]|uniref:pentatricopeptide repeat-containing protein At2g01740 isoform X2 n=1 Tax=Carica papaya TaxID=3649 RepID=UPI000B8CB15E|nr:pentatricopeptide repeat-containing protein At2g01740 isoform X2 [Carica papaya]